MARGAQSGRIHLHQRNTDDVSEVIHADIAITAEHAEEINATTKKKRWTTRHAGNIGTEFVISTDGG